MNALEALTLARSKGLSPSGMHVLLSLVEDSPAMMTTTAKVVGVSPSSMTHTIDRLERDGWVTRISGNKDRRTVWLAPSEKAFDLLTPTLEP